MAVPAVDQHAADEQGRVAGKQQVFDQEFQPVGNGFPPDHRRVAGQSPGPEYWPHALPAPQPVEQQGNPDVERGFNNQAPVGAIDMGMAQVFVQQSDVQ